MTKSPRMVDLVKEYIAYRRSLGFQLAGVEPLLLQFAKYADQIGHRGPLTTDLALRWIGLPSAASSGYLARRLDVVRGFARYRSIVDPRTEIPSTGLLGAAHRRRTPHIYSDTELASLLAEARRLRPSTGLTPHTYATLFGLLACAGLRVSEALKLTRDDIDWGQGLLTVRQTKFRKTRLVPLHASSLRVLREYADRRDRFHPCPTVNAFFLTRRGTYIPLVSVEDTFCKLRKRLGWATRQGNSQPRIHDLRHNAASRIMPTRIAG